jgi:hypothetical protein
MQHLHDADSAVALIRFVGQTYQFRKCNGHLGLRPSVQRRARDRSIACRHGLLQTLRTLVLAPLTRTACATSSPA